MLESEAYERCVRLLCNGKWPADEDMAYLNSCIASFPWNCLLHRIRALAGPLWLRSGHEGERHLVLESCRIVLDSDPLDVDVIGALSRQLTYTGQYEESLFWANRALDLEPSVSHYEMRAGVLWKLHGARRAAESLSEAECSLWRNEELTWDRKNWLRLAQDEEEDEA